MPNQGYLSEAAASLVDTKLGLGVVPRTKVKAVNVISLVLWQVFQVPVKKTSTVSNRWCIWPARHSTIVPLIEPSQEGRNMP